VSNDRRGAGQRSRVPWRVRLSLVRVASKAVVEEIGETGDARTKGNRPFDGDDLEVGPRGEPGVFCGGLGGHEFGRPGADREDACPGAFNSCP